MLTLSDLVKDVAKRRGALKDIHDHPPQQLPSEGKGVKAWVSEYKEVTAFHTQKIMLLLVHIIRSGTSSTVTPLPV